MSLPGFRTDASTTVSRSASVTDVSTEQCSSRRHSELSCSVQKHAMNARTFQRCRLRLKPPPCDSPHRNAFPKLAPLCVRMWNVNRLLYGP
jgi:hypothetical protein